MTENKINRCNENGMCEAQCLEEQEGCGYFKPAQTLFPGMCVHLQKLGDHCLSPEALTAKWKKLKKAEGERPKAEVK